MSGRGGIYEGPGGQKLYGDGTEANPVDDAVHRLVTPRETKEEVKSPIVIPECRHCAWPEDVHSTPQKFCPTKDGWGLMSSTFEPIVDAQDPTVEKLEAELAAAKQLIYQARYICEKAAGPSTEDIEQLRQLGKDWEKSKNWRWDRLCSSCKQPKGVRGLVKQYNALGPPSDIVCQHPFHREEEGNG